ncbi:MAG TPA: response regulator, partial [Candidatus Cloacimonadota bacterium]|nr:response regulator [Candidatus Cloacimonadota bacterium]
MNKLGLIELNDSLADIQNKCDLLGYQTIHFNYFHFTSQLFSVREENQFLCLKDEIETFIFNEKIDILLVDSEILLMLPAYIKKQIKLLFFKVPVIIVVTEIIKALENILMDLNPSDILFHYQSLNDFDFRLKTAFQRSNALNHFYAEHVELIETKNKLSVVNKQLEETIEHSNRLALVAELAKITQANFLSNMSHEMRTPLNGLLGITHLLAQTTLNNEQKEYVELINTSSENLLTLISDILDYSRIDAGKMNLRIEEFSINEKIVKMLKTLTVKAYQKGLELIYEQDPTLPEIIRGDYSRINQILINLVGNAIKFTEKGEIKVSIRQKKIVNEHHRVLEFMVQDSGVGISEDNLDNIFEAFYQVEERTTKRYAGTGLGLAICKQLVSLMNGSIWVESEPGAGSTFWFSVHVDVPQQKAENEYDKEISGHKHVLIVDDSAGVRKYLRNILVASKMTADTAENEEECQRFLEHSEKNHRPYDLALVDLTLKDSDGWNIIKMIHNNPLNKDCKVIIITGLNEYNVSEYAKEAGAEAVLKKPVSRDELISTIQSVFAQNVNKNEKVSGRCAISAEQMALADKKTNQPSIEMMQKKLNILLVEDEAINRKFAERLLSREGHQITIAVNGLEAIEKYANDVFDVILMDVQMAEMNGIEATKRIREIENVKNIHT